MSNSSHDSTPKQPPRSTGRLFSKFPDPLTPASRRVLDTSHGSFSSRRQENESPLSPRQAMIQVLQDNANVVTPASLSFTAAHPPPTTSSYSRSDKFDVSSSGVGSILSSSPRSTTTSVTTTMESKDLFPQNDPRILTFGTKVRLRFGAGKYLSMRNGSNSKDYPAGFSTASSSSRSVPAEVEVCADGNGLDGDDDQIFMIQNCNMRKDRRPIQLSDRVSFHCVGRHSLYLSAHETSSTIVARRGHIITPQESWSIQRLQTTNDVSTTGDRRRQDDNYLRTGDRIVLSTRSSARMTCHTERLGSESCSTVKLLMDGEASPLDTAVVEISNASVPYTPYWNKSRAFLNLSYLWRTEDGGDDTLNRRVPLSIQEQLLVEDMLYVMLGIPGSHIRAGLRKDNDNVDDAAERAERAVSFRVHDTEELDPSHAILVKKMLPMCEKYVHLSQFIEQKMGFEYGQVVHAFSAAMKDLLKEYTVVVAQLESRARSGELSLQKLWFYIQPSMRTIDLLYQLVIACSDSYGGELLTAIHACSASAGDGLARDTLRYLLHSASAPYLRMLELWIYSGTVDDPYDEFMVKNDEKLLKEDLQKDPWCKYWEKRYTLRESQMPIFLSRWSEKILTTGKYLNVVRSCIRREEFARQNRMTTIEYIHGERAYEDIIDRAHAYASRHVLSLMLTEHKLLQRLSSLKHYFLMDQGDFFVEFMDIAEKELNEPAQNVSTARLESLLHLALQTSSCALDAFKDDLTCLLSPNDLRKQMETIYHRSTKRTDAPVSFSTDRFSEVGYKAVDAFTLNYRVEWPLSLIISASSVNKYQMIFRHLFFCKHVERRLCDAWLNHKATKEFDIQTELAPFYCLRQRMLHFQQNLGYFMVFEVVAPRWHALEKKLQNASTVDEILLHHKDFLDNCLKECLLTDPDLLLVLTSLMNICMTFADSIEKFTKPYILDEDQIKAERDYQREAAAQRGAGAGAEAPPGRRRRSSGRSDARKARISAISNEMRRALAECSEANYAKDFDDLLGQLMKKLLEQSHLQFNSYLSNLCTRINYNEFYTS